MSVKEKVRLVERHRSEHGLARTLAAAGLPPSTWYQRQTRVDPAERDRHLKEQVLEIIKDHPDYGYRRILPEVKERTRRVVNHKRLRRVLKSYQLGLRRVLPKYRKSAIQEVLDPFRGQLDLVNGRQSCEPMQALSTDFTELVYARGQRKAYLMAHVDIESKVVPRFSLAQRANRELALAAWKNAKPTLSDLGFSAEGLIVHSDQDALAIGDRRTRVTTICISFSSRTACGSHTLNEAARTVREWNRSGVE